MDSALDSGCVFDPVAHVYLFLRLHLAAPLPELELCPSFHLVCHLHFYSLRAQLERPVSGILEWRGVHQEAGTWGAAGVPFMRARVYHSQLLVLG